MASGPPKRFMHNVHAQNCRHPSPISHCLTQNVRGGKSIRINFTQKKSSSEQVFLNKFHAARTFRKSSRKRAAFLVFRDLGWAFQQFRRVISTGSLPPKTLGKSCGPPQSPAEPSERPRRAPAEPSERPPQIQRSQNNTWQTNTSEFS